jgi:hypothetical protein
MTWTAFYQADGEMRHEIATTNFEWSAEHQREKFVAKMTNPGAQIFWTWVEPTAIKNLDDLGQENNEGLPEPVVGSDGVVYPLPFDGLNPFGPLGG